MDPDRAAWSGGGELEPYSVLQVSRGATLEEVRHAYKAMALRTHPDKPGGDEKSFQEVVAAFEQISQLLSAQYSGSCPRGGAACGLGWVPGPGIVRRVGRIETRISTHHVAEQRLYA